MAKTAADWEAIRRQFAFANDSKVNLSAMVIASNPAPIARAIKRHRRKIDRQPWLHLLRSLHTEERQVCEAASEYFGIAKEQIALTTGTTLGLSLLYAGVRMRPEQEILTSRHEFSAAHKIFDSRTTRQQTVVRRLPLIPDPPNVSIDAILAQLEGAVTPQTRVLALQWVYSNTGVKLPLARIAEWLQSVNAERSPEDRVLLCIDGVHGFGAEGDTFQELGCDFFVAGCHKWVFGPRGTGIWCGTTEAWAQYDRLVPSSSDERWVGLKHTPGGLQAYEHAWATENAFRYLTRIGRHEIRDRVHALATDLKQRLSRLPQVSLITPMSQDYSSGVICFDVRKYTTKQAVDALMKKGIIATSSSLDAGRNNVNHVRLSVAIFNTEDELKRCEKAVASLR